MKLLADENFKGAVVRELKKRKPELEIIRAQDTALFQAPDPILLEWAAQNDYIVLSHDVQTLVGFAYQRVAEALPMPGLCIISSRTDIGVALKVLLLWIETAKSEEMQNQVIFLA